MQTASYDWQYMDEIDFKAVSIVDKSETHQTK